ncbi:myogenesis-regulating glycosidase-like [Biomphalaria glabrata]|uniref:Myogenesis-regulating glycosidase-like n=1 Tax=Biomphalaria glabrata TaxID=6526 RepID=A0A9W2YLY9_BIOGL|nr:myogenesis-regulating glycosidase-like [Biomphalaria glabrata]
MEQPVRRRKMPNTTSIPRSETTRAIGGSKTRNSTRSGKEMIDKKNRKNKGQHSARSSSQPLLLPSSPFFAMPSKVHLVITILCVVLMLGLLSGVGVYIWKEHFDDDVSRSTEPENKTSPLDHGPISRSIVNWSQLNFSSNGIIFDAITKSTQGKGLKGILGKGLDATLAKPCNLTKNSNDDGLCLELGDKYRLEVLKKPAIAKRSTTENNLQCFSIHWIPLVANQLKETQEDCFYLSNLYWFGGFESETQEWPMNNYQKNLSAFITGDSFQGNGGYFGSVVEGIFLSSSGLGIVVDETTPLYISVNQGGSPLLCMVGKVGSDTPFFNISNPFLKYDVCQSSDIASLWQGISNKYIPKPASVPSLDLFRYPIWCTWAIYKEVINESTVLEFAKDIVFNNLSFSQLEIDDSWTPHYGDFNFTSDRFPDAVGLIKNLTAMNIPATIWMHPFFNNDSDAFQELSSKGYLIRELDSDKPHLVSWWRGENNAGVLDFTNPEAVNWYLSRLEYLKKTFNVTSFKFDAGELTWVPGKYRLNDTLVTPNYLTSKYIEMTSRGDLDQRRQEVRSGFRSQNSTFLLRMLDRRSDWSHALGLKTLIPCSLAFGMMGYPYVLPDLIGGNDYGEGFPSQELFIRWLQATVFMPVLQFSIPPWHYNDSKVVELSHKYIQLHEKYADKIINLAKNAEKTGQPINRPLWWIAPQDDEALRLDSEFLLGDDLLVAPVLDEGSTSRDIYLPSGQWKDENKGTIIDGGVWVRNYSAPLELLPYFTKV